VQTLRQDLRYGLRILARSPGFVTVAVLTLALGIGANTAIFSVIDAVLLRPLPYKDPSRLVIIWQSDAAHRESGAWFDTYREFEEWAQHSQSFEKLAAFTWAREETIVRLRGTPEHVLGIPVSGDFFSALGVDAAYGRTFAPADAGDSCAAVLSDGFWLGKLGGANIVGHTLTVNDRPCVVVGIMPKDFSFYPKQTELWILISPQSEYAKDPWHEEVGVLGRLKPGVTRTSAEVELTALQAHIADQAPSSLTLLKAEPDALELQSEFIWLTGRNLRKSLWVLFAAVIFVLLIACVNVATLFLGRAAERQREFGVRAALGSTRLRTVRQLLTESLLLSAAGTLLGVFLATVGTRYLKATNSVELPPGNPVTLNWQILAFAALVAVLSAVLFGLAPAWKASRYDLNALLKNDSRSSNRAVKVFVVSEVALSLVLLAGAGLMMQSLVRLTSTPLGFNPARVLTGNIDLPTKTYSTPEQRLKYYHRMESAVVSIPGVEGVAIAPLVPSGANPLTVEGRTNPAYGGAVGNDVSDAPVDTDYFRVMDVPLLRGRAFSASDRKGTLPVAIVNEALAEEYFRGDAIGQHIKLGTPQEKGPWLTVVGVVGNVKSFTVFKEMGYVTSPCVYRPLAQGDVPALAIFVLSALPASTLAPTVRNEFLKLDPNLPPPDLTTMRDWLSQFFAQPRFRTVLFCFFAVLALLLCSLGIFGVMSRSVTQRHQEIGIRMALGAQRRDTLFLVLRDGVALTALGIVVGVIGALGLTRAVRGLLYGVRAADPLTFAVVATLLILVAVAACYIPARRAMRVDPIVALRHD
jgi:predicted permease